MKEVLGFRLRSGEDMVGQVVSEDNGTYVIYRPAVPINVPQQDPNTGKTLQGDGLTMLKWAPFADQEEFTFTPNDYVGEPYKVWKELLDFYLQSTTTIAIAPGQPLMGKLNG